MPAPRVLRLELEYDGAGFAGWAAQPGLRTVEGVVRDALGVLLREPVGLVVAGRTDAGVHARGQVASLATSSGLPPARILRGLAGLLPPDVAARDVREAPAGFDARRDAVARRYEYRVLTGPPSPLRRALVLHHPAPLDTDALDAAAALVVGRHDFRAFTPTRTEHVFFHRTVTACSWERRGDELVMTVEADAFLRHMVRVLVGTMLLVGRGAWPADRLAALLEGAPRGAAGRTAPAHPLTLVGVRYPDDDGRAAGPAATLPGT
ncbi:tRNA pseudouridine(38-40) synthase TruA [Miltoncostaea marina]|uniref:tRNA pseudouridine(38-40) synthase TruA n=1 Tax=Miltoncostaea marina TaxID=2843215 RepID=UPI001C3E115B|nr:tRNA pseudouridine(38-40) synthase TruA [Miltoncostaea marina]